MGCNGSKLRNQEPIVLCRGRADLLGAAVRYRDSLATAHSAFSSSLVSLSSSLHHLLSLSYPRLPLPPHRKPEPSPPPSHIHFHPSDSDSETESDSSSLVHHLHYARSQPPPNSVSFEHQPPTSETVNFGYSNPYGHADVGRFWGASYSYPSSVPQAHDAAAPPPPPSPPRANTWDFLNPFESYYGNYYWNSNYYTPSRSSKEVRDEEGIPELEADDDEVVVKEAYGDQKSRASVSSSASRMERSDRGGNGEHEKAEVVDKGVVSNKERKRFGDVSDVVDEIKAQFDRASEAALELSTILEVGKQRYQQNSSIYEVSSRMASLDFEEDSLSSTMQRLYVWEMKLYNEVKAEEKMRLHLAKNSKRLKRLDQMGAEAHKIDSTRKLIKKLSTKIRITIRVVNSISSKINKLRDEELWPQINALIQGFVRMWRVMHQCHQMQCQAISEAKNLDSMVSGGKIGGAIMQLELELMKWIANFSSWVNAQRNYIKALNGWLALCLNYEPKVTVDGVPPYSPGRIGAPPVFVICNVWSQAMRRISEREVVDAMQALATYLRHLWEQQNVEQHERMIAMREMDRWFKAKEKNAEEIHREVDALNKKLALVPGQSSLPWYIHQVHESYSPEASGLQIGLQHIFESLENFTTSSLEAFEELLKHAERKE
ncbi:uncharacterized protein [Typha angustifolia]|uniref:uncharacterized protein n=1 Tax=Typha angustifolia TaxID=59011 RepID=UPI003C2E0D6C